MPEDFSMCSNDGCEYRQKCYRYMARPSEYQVYTRFDCNDENEYEHYIKLNRYKADRDGDYVP